MYAIAAISTVALFTSCFEKIEENIGSIEDGAAIFESYCADCHDLGEADVKFYLGVTYHIQDLEDYIQSDMPLETGGATTEDCDAQCAADVAAYIQQQMCEGEENLTLCDPDSTTGDQVIANGDTGTKIALGALQFKYECSSCHNITPDTQGPNPNADVFVTVASTKYFSELGLETFIEEKMPLGSAASCDAECAENVTIYLQSEFCDDQTTYAFCGGWDPTAI